MAGTEAAPPRPMPVLAVHGTLDRAIRYGGYTYQGQALYQSVAGTVAFWAAHNGCAPTPHRATNWASRQDRYAGGREGSAVVLYTIKRGGHGWPANRVARRLVAGRRRPVAGRYPLGLLRAVFPAVLTAPPRVGTGQDRAASWWGMAGVQRAQRFLPHCLAK